MKKNQFFCLMIISAAFVFSACKHASDPTPETEQETVRTEFTVSIVSNREIYEGEFSGMGDYKPGQKVTIKMNWFGRGDNFVGFYDESYNLLSEAKQFSFNMPHNDFKIQALFYKEGDKPLKAGDYVFFGMYPQEKNFINNPTEDNYIPQNISLHLDFVSNMNQYDFYESGQLVTDAFYYLDWYLDEQYLYKKYRRAFFYKLQYDQYGGRYYYRMGDCRSTFDHTSKNHDSSTGSWGINSELDYYQAENGFQTVDDNFLFQPIKWKILCEDNGKTTLLATKALDSQQFYHSVEDREINGQTIHPNNWEHSDIRKWLNKDFYETAFTKGCEQYIVPTLLDNINTAWLPLQPGDDDHLIRIGKNSSSENQNNTTDKVFLPSAKDCCNAQYGFYADNDGWDPARKFLPTSYSKAMGIRVDYGHYSYDDEYDIHYEARNNGYATYVWTRSGLESGTNIFSLFVPTPENHQGVICMDDLGDLEQAIFVTKTWVGVVPEIVIKLE